MADGLRFAGCLIVSAVGRRALSSKKLAALVSPLISGAQFYLLGAEGIVFYPASKQLYYLNTTASYIWCGLEEGLEPPQIVHALAGQFQISQTQANRDVYEALNSWVSDGLPAIPSPAISENPVLEGDDGLSSDKANAEYVAKECHRYSGVGQDEPNRLQPKPASQLSPSVFDLHRSYNVGDLDFCIRFASSEAESRVHPALAHLEAAPKTESAALPVSITILEDDGLFSVVYREIEYGGLVTSSELVPLIHQLILTRAYNSSACLAAFHSGAIGGDKGCVMLPGAPGSGKSTLIAALMKSGLTYLTDELVLLMPDSALRPLPISMGIKRGAWSLLAPAIPVLGDLPVHRQPDGTEVRYLPPSSVSLPDDNLPLRALVFPKYLAGAQTQLAPLSAAKAFYRLAVAGYAVHGDLDSSVVSGLIDWIGRQECYELQVGDLSSAVSAVRELLA